jgi:hypothetical protein
MNGVRDFYFYHSFQTGYGANPPLYPVGTRRWVFSWNRMAEHKIDHAHPPCVKVNPSLQFSVDVAAGI